MKSLILAALLAVACHGANPRAPAAASAGSHRLLGPATRPLDARKLTGGQSFGSSTVLAVDAGISGDRISALFEIPARDCAVIIARGSSSVEDLDLLAYGEDGAELGTDEAPDREPALLICPPHPGRVFVAARIAQGNGLVALGAELLPVDRAKAAAKRYSVKDRSGGDSARLTAWPGLDELVTSERRRVGGRFQDLRRVAIATDPALPTNLAATLEAGGCVHALFIPADEVSHLDVAVLDPEGRALGRASGSGRLRSLVVCSPVKVNVTFEVRPHAGSGLVVAVLSRALPGSEADITTEIARYQVFPTSDVLAEHQALDERLKKAGYAASQPAYRGKLLVGQRVATSLALESGCSRIDVVGGAPLRGIDARLWSESGELRGAESGGGLATLFACGKTARPRLDLSALVHPGPFSVSIHHEASVPEALLRAPLAASRLLGRMTARGVLKRADAIGNVSELSLSADSLTQVPLLVPVDRCLELDVALDRGAAGVELRAVEVGSERELDISVGESSAALRLCAFGRGAQGSLVARAELRTLAASGVALLATRLLEPAP